MNKNIISTKNGRNVPPADTLNAAGGLAYSTSNEHALAQYAVTGTLHNTYYASAETQMEEVLRLVKTVEPRFVAQVAIYARKQGFMKDIPAMLVAHLATTPDKALFRRTFEVVIDDFKMLRNFMQAVRSGVVGRKSFGSTAKKAIQKFFDSKTDSEVFAGSIGNDPSMADMVKMAHPRPKTDSRANLFAYLLGKKFALSMLPEEARQFELFKNNPSGQPPAVNFQFLSSIKMSTDQWTSLAETMSWHTLRMNLNTLNRNGVLKDKTAVKAIAKRLADKDTIAKLKVFPYQLLAAYLNTTDVPTEINVALQDALEHATANVPEFDGDVVVAVDTSGSMGFSITGARGTATSKVRCVDVAGLVAASILRRNPSTKVLPFDTEVHSIAVNPRDSVATNAQKLARGGGGTDCGSALRHMNDRKLKGDLVIYVSDNESWVQMDRTHDPYYRTNAPTMATEWAAFKKRNPKAKLVLLDIQPNSTTQKQDDKDVLNVGGFSDKVFQVVDLFLKNELGGDHWVKVIKNIEV